MRSLAATLLLVSSAALAQGQLRVPVVDGEGAPVPGARVLVLNWADVNLDGGEENLVRDDAETNEKGLAIVRLPLGQDHVCLLAFHGKQAVFACHTPLDHVRKDGFRLQLGPARAIRGKVVGTGDEPVEGARVRLIFPGGYEMHGIDASVGKDGTFVLPPLPSTVLAGDDIRLEAKAPGCAPWARDLVATEIREGVTVKLQAARTVSGRVVDPDGKPVEGAEVWIGFWMTRRKAKSGADGTFALGGVPSGQATLHVLPPQHVLKTIVLEPKDGAVDLGDVPVAEGKVVRGTVAEFDGAEIRRAFIALETQEGVRVRTAEAGADGKFELPGVGAGPHRLDCWIHSVKDIGGTRKITRTNVQAGGPALHLVAREGIHLRLLDRSGKPYFANEVRLTFGLASDAKSTHEVSSDGAPFHEIRLPPIAAGVTFDLRVRSGSGHEATLRGLKSDAHGRVTADVEFDADAPTKSDLVLEGIPVESERELPPAKYGANADKADVRKYVAAVLASAGEDRKRWSMSDPQYRQLLMVGPAHVDVLIDALGTDHNIWIRWAIDALVDESHKELVLTSLAAHRELAKCVVDHRWASDAEATLVAGLRGNPRYVPTEWIAALASLGKKEHYPLLLGYLERGANPSHTWDAVRDLPDLDARESVAKMWATARGREWSRKQAAYVAVEFGHVDALAVLIDVVESGDQWDRRRAMDAVTSWTGRKGTATEVVAWFRTNRDTLTFDEDQQRYVVAAK